MDSACYGDVGRAAARTLTPPLHQDELPGSAVQYPNGNVVMLMSVSAVFPEPAISATHCPRLYGIFADEAKCDVFWNCWNGEASRYQCSPGLAYDREARVCMWADQVPECKVEGEYVYRSLS